MGVTLATLQVAESVVMGEEGDERRVEEDENGGGVGKR